MHPAPYFDDVLPAEELIITTVGICVDIALEACQEIQRPLLAPVMGEVIDRQRWIGAPSDIGPKPGLLYPAVALDLKGNDGVIGENHIALKNGSLQLIPKGAYRIIDLKDPTGLGSPGDVHPLPLKDAVLAIKRKVVGKLAHKDVGKKPDVGFALLNGMIRHGSRENPEITATIQWSILGPLIDVDDEFPGPVLELLRDLPADHVEGFAGLGADLVLFRDVQDNLHPLQVLRDGNPSGVIALRTLILLCLGFLKHRKIRRRLGRREWLLNGVEHQVIEHELVGIQPLRAAAVDSSQELIKLVLKHGDVLLGCLELPGQGFDLELLLIEEFIGFDDRRYHGAINRPK